MNEINHEGLERLCAEIIKQACKEYKSAYKRKDMHQLNALERYFYGPAFEMHSLGKISPSALLHEIRKQVDAGINRKYEGARIKKRG